MMECYYGHGSGDLALQKDTEYFDRLPSPDSWSQWGTYGSGNSGWPNNFDAGKVSNLPDEKSQQQMLFGSGNKCVNQSEEVEQSYGSSNFEGSSEDSLRRNSAACGRPEYCLNNLTGFDPMDDIFLSSFLQDDVSAAAHSHGSVPLSPQAQYSMMSSDNDLANRMSDFQSVPCEAEGARSVKSFRTATFSASDASENGDFRLSNVMYRNNSDQSSAPSEKSRDTFSSDQEASRGSGDNESLIEESVLIGLENVLNQLSNETRLSFRDSLYRLAEHSKQQTPMDAKVEGFLLERNSSLEAVDGLSRSGKTEAAEMETNTIDRAVANLMFSKVNANVQDILPAMAAKFECNGTNFASGEACDDGMDQTEMFVSSKPCDLVV